MLYDGGQTFTYDVANKVVTSSWNGLWQGYDGNGQRVKKQFHSAEYAARNRTDEQFVHDMYYAWQQRPADEEGYAEWVRTISGSGREHVIDGFADGGEFAGRVGALCAGTATEAVIWQLTDQVGSVRMVVSESGAVQEIHDTAPFGDEINWGAVRATNNTAQAGQTNAADTVTSTGLYGWNETIRARYGSLERDTPTGLEHTQWRKYDGWQGRWTTTDPSLSSMSVGDPQSLNRYSYVQNDPVNGVDPRGLDANAAFDVIGYLDDPFDDPFFRRGGGGGGSGHIQPVRTLDPPADPVTPDPLPQETYPGVLANIRIIDTGGDTAVERNAQQLKTRMMRLALSKRCNDAFRRAGRPTPNDLVQKGFSIASRRALTDPAYNKALGITEEIRAIANTSTAPAQTIRPQFTSSGKAVIILAGDAFVGNYLDEGIPHELIHAGGVDKAPSSGYPLRGTDLGRFPGYDDIIENCK